MRAGRGRLERSGGRPPRLAIVVPRYGRELAGGAEYAARSFAFEAAGRGWPIELWTTCASDHFTWANVLPAGHSTEEGVTIHRFPITARAPRQQAALEGKLVARGHLDREEQYAWLSAAAHSTPMYAALAARSAAFDAVLAIPYANPLTHYAAWVAPERTLFWPCLHNEPYAYLEPVRLVMETVRGVLFNSPEEELLATQTLRMRPRRTGVLGVGAALSPPPPARMEAGQPYLVYVGRLEEGKNLRRLYDFVGRYASEGGEVRLVVVGAGPLQPPAEPAFDYRGFTSEEEKAVICANALALCQPSLNESFSVTIMESWLAGRPVLVAETCAVTREHVRRSRGGLWFESYDDFAGAVTWLRDHSAEAARMGQNGRRYVAQNYTWTAVVDRFERIFRAWHAYSA